MPRKPTTWTPTYGKWKPGAMELAMKAVKEKTLKLREAALQYGVPASTLCRRLKKDIPADSPASRPRTFTLEDEKLLVKHCQEMEGLGFGLDINAVCKLAYEMAEENGATHRFNKETEKAGYDWYQGFMARHPTLSLRKPEGLSAARAAMLNPKVLEDHFKKLGNVLDKTGLKSKPGQIYNLDETGLSLVHVPSKIIATKGKKTIQSRTSGDRGENVSVLICANAQGSVLPPFIIFKGKRLNQGLTTNAPPGALFGVSDSSFINADLFENWFERMFIPSLPPARPVLLVLDGHYSHITLQTLRLAREQDIHIYCLPPHTTNHTQPLDKSVFKSVKVAYNKRCEKFMRDNPHRLITRYDFCGLFRDVFHSVLTMQNITSGFKCTGIYPFNPNAITTEHMQFSAVETELEFEGEEDSAQPTTSAQSGSTQTSAQPTTSAQSGSTQSSPTPQSADKPSTVIPVLIHVDLSVDGSIPQCPTASGEASIVTASEEIPVDLVSSESPMDIDPPASADDSPDQSLSEIPHSSHQTARFETLFQKPVVKKVVKKASNKRTIFEARCLTADEIYEAELEKQQKKERELVAKEARKVERERKRQEREAEKQKKQAQKLLKQKEREEKQKEKEEKQKQKKQKKNPKQSTTASERETAYDRDNLENYCAHCEGFYGDDEDAEDWWQCTNEDCQNWLHESCTGLYGKTSMLQAFVCSSCKANSD